jgi:hypothetical protein
MLSAARSTSEWVAVRHGQQTGSTVAYRSTMITLGLWGDKIVKLIVVLAGIALAAGCTSSNTVRTSQDTAIIRTDAAPVCGGVGAARVAQRQAAIETIRAGYDRYVIFDGASANNVRTSQMPGSYQTSGMMVGNTFNATTTYRPGPVIVAGAHSQSFAIKMFRESDPAAGQALSAREMLGPEWQKAVDAGSLGTCLGGQ